MYQIEELIGSANVDIVVPYQMPDSRFQLSGATAN